MKIGIDFDNSLVNSNFVELVCNKYKLSTTYPADWEMSNLPEHVVKEIKSYFTDPTCKVMTTFKPFPGVTEKLNKWIFDEHELFIITARVNVEYTKEYIKRLFPFFNEDNIIVVGLSGCKADSIIKNGNEIMIDDMFHSPVLDIPGLYKILISNTTTPYNYMLRNRVNMVVDKFVDINLKKVCDDKVW